MKSILIVEDDESQRIIYQEEFKELGYRVYMASTGEEAVQLVKERKPDLVILDIMLPGISGLETLRELLNIDPKLPVIINSAYSHYKESFMSWAAVEYIVKSSDLSDLVNRVKEILD